MANLAFLVAMVLVQKSISSCVKFASPRHISHPTIVICPFLAEEKTISAASGSHQILYSAAGVTLPTQQAAPPITTMFLIKSMILGSLLKAVPKLVNGPKVTIVISFGFSKTVLI